MAQPAFSLFDTAIGHCGIVWSDRGVVSLQLPEQSLSVGRAQLKARHPGAKESVAPLAIAEVVARLRALLKGEQADLSQIELDMEHVAPFPRRVYQTARKIPLGTTVSYGELARALGTPGAARAVGRALGRNPFALIVPCHRVVAKGGMGGFTAFGGLDTKQRLLAIEATALYKSS